MKVEHAFFSETQAPQSGPRNNGFGEVISSLEQEGQQQQARAESEGYGAPEQEQQGKNYWTDSPDTQEGHYPYEEYKYDYSYYNPQQELDLEEILPPQDYYTHEQETEQPYLYYRPVIEAVAQVLEVEPQKVVEILEKENIQPKELAQPTYQHKVVQVAYQAETPVELLQVEEIAKVFAELTEAVEKAAQEIAVKTYAPVAEVAVQEQATSLLAQSNPESTQVATQPEISVEQKQLTTTEQTPQQLLQQQQTEQPTQQLFNNVVVEQEQAPVPKPTPTPTAPNPQPTAPQILEQIQGQLIKLVQVGAAAEMRLVLSPESLGEVSLRIATQNGIVVAQFMAQNQRVKEVIESNLGQLQEELERQGLQVSELSVSVRQENQSQMDAYLREQEKSRRRISTIIQNIIDEDEEPEQEIQLEGTTVNLRA
ncbi:MAG: flagellar hook-length control protein FliK [Defluviitaleaceae bacterium]|nr:flagellar hook-length control protein FliK [Defluviitaleaceae bacterium]